MGRGELDPNDPLDSLLLAAMREQCRRVADGVLAHAMDHGDRIEIRGVLADQPRIVGAVGRWLDSLPADRTILVPAVVSDRLVGMLARRGFEGHTWWDPAICREDDGAMIRKAS